MRFNLQILLRCCALSVATGGPGVWGDPSPAEMPSPGPASPWTNSAVHAAFQLTPRLWSGAQPGNDEAFAELARSGVKVVISVDGASPDLETARRHGLRYVHVPIGYDGVSSTRLTQLVQATRESAGIVFVHCHHGRHRGPAAAAIMAMADGAWSPTQAASFLTQAGTDPSYVGLYTAVQNFALPATPPAGDAPPLAASVPPSGEVEVMVTLDGHLDRLKVQVAQRDGWESSGDSQGLRTEALLMLEALREWGRHPDIASRTPGYRQQLAETVDAAQRLWKILENPATDPGPALKALGTACSACHRQHRH